MANSSTKTSVSTPTTVAVETWTTTLNFATEQTIALLVKYAAQRGLDTAYFSRRRQTIEDGVWTWLSSRHLDTVYLEVYRKNQSEEIVERFDLPFTLVPPGEASDEQRRRVEQAEFDSLHDEVLRRVRTLDAPPDDCTCRMVVSLHDTNEEGDPPPDVDGWSPTRLKDVSSLAHEELGSAFDAGTITASAELWTSFRSRDTEETSTGEDQ